MIRITKTLQRAGCALLLGLAVATCRDDPTGPGQRASLALAPVLPAQALNLAAFGLSIDSLRVIIVRPPSDTVVNTTVAFAVDQDSVALPLELDLEAETETFDVTLQLRGGGFVLFSATTTVDVTAGQSGAGDPVEIANFAYTGPGAGITHLVVSPEDSVIRLSDSLRFRVDAFNLDLPVTQFYVTWSTTNETLAPINAHGVLLAPNLRGGVQVIATTPNGIADTVPVTFVPVPVSIVPVGPIPVDVAPGSLIGPLRARVLASDGFGVKGIPVTFAAVSGGGSVNNALVVSDTGGYVETSATAGGGPVSVYTATVAGVATPATFNVTILAAPVATQLAFTVPPAGTVVDLPFGVLVEVRDGQGNVVTGASDPVTIALGANPGSATLGGTLTVNAVQGVAVFGDLTINQPDSGYTLVVTAPGLAPDTTPPFSVIPGFTGRLWTNPAGGNWTDPANWSGGIVPGVGDTVFVTLDGNYTVTLDTNVSIGVLFLGGSSGTQTLTGVSRTLQVDSALEIFATGAVQLTNSTLAGTGSFLFNAGRLSLQQVTVAHHVLNSTGAQMTARGFVRLSSDFLNSADALVTVEADPNCCTATLEVEGNSFSNSGLILLTAVNGAGTTASLQVSNATAFNLPGGVIAALPGTGGARVLNLDLANSGTVQVDADVTLSHTSADHDNGGTILLNGGNLTITQAGVTPSFTTSGSIVVGAGRVLTVSGGAFDYVNSVPGGLAGLGTVSFANATVNLTPDLTNDTLSLGFVNTTVNGIGTLTNPVGRVLTVQQTAINTPFVNAGTFVVHGASSLNGTITAAATGTIRVEGDPGCCVATLTTATGFTNDGLIELTSINTGGTTATLAVTSGTLVNAAGGTIAALPGTGGARELQAQLSNDGTLLVAQDLTLSKADADHLNSGSIQLTSANLSLSQSGANPTFTTTGSIGVAAGRTFGVSGGAFQYSNPAPGGLTGSGVVSFVNTTLQLGPALTHDTLSLELVNAIVNGPGTLTIAAGTTMTIQQTAINAPFVNQGVLVARGASSLSGGVATSVGSTIQLQADPNCCVSTLDVSSGFTNNGLIELTAINGTGTTATLNVLSGFLVNASGATIAARAGSGGVRNVNAALNNQGTLLVETDMSLGAASADHVNSGLIHVSGGILLIPQNGITPTFTTTGSIVVDVGRSFQLAGPGTFNYANAAPGGLAGQGSYTFLNAVVNITPALSNDTFNISLTNSTVNGPGVLTNAAGRFLTVEQSAINASFVNQGVLVAHGASTLGGSVTAAAGGTIRIQADPSCCVATLAVANPLTNDGLIELTAVNGTGTTATLDVTGGLTNGSGGTIAVVPGSGGGRVIAAPITNHGTITIATTATIGSANASHVNNGTISVTAGTLDLPLTGTSPAFTNQGMLTVATGATVAVTGGAAGSFTNAATGTLAGGGTFDVSATSFTNDGTVAPGGAPGVLTIAGSYSTGPNAVLSVELGGTTAGTQYDQLALGAGSVGGTLNITLINGFVPSIGSSFTIVTGTALTGGFGLTNLPVVGGAAWQVQPTATAVTLVLIPGTQANVKVWDNALGGNWGDGLNWLPPGVPGAGDSVVIDLIGTYTVTVDVAASASFVNIGGLVGTGTRTLSLPGSSLTLGAGALIGASGVLNVTGGTLTGGGDVIVNGAMNWTAGTVSGVGFLTVGPPGTLNLSGAAARLLNTRSLLNQGSVVWTGGLFNTSSTTITNTGTFDIRADVSLVWSGGSLPTFDNNGPGTLLRSIGTGVVTLDVVFNNAGAFDVQSGRVKLTRGGSVDNDYSVQAAGVLEFAGGTHTINTGADLQGAGAFELTGSGVLNLAATDTVTVNRFHQLGGTLTGAAPFQPDSLTWSGGLQQGTGVTRIATGATLHINGGTLNWNRPLLNQGTLRWTAGTIAGGSVTLQNSGLFDVVVSSGSMTWNTGPTPPQLDNQGTVLRRVGPGFVSLNVFVNNDGTLDAQSGILSLDRGGAGKGQYIVSDPSAALRFAGVGAHVLSSGARVLGEGLVNFTGADVSLSGAGSSYDVTGITQIVAGVIDLSPPDTVRMKNFHQFGGFLKGSAPILIGEAAILAGGTLDGDPGTVLIVPTATALVFDEAGTKFLSNRRIIASGQVAWLKGDVAMSGGAVLDMQPSTTFDVLSVDQWQGSGTIEIRDRATMNVLTPGAVAIGPGTALNIGGTLDIRAGATVKMTGDFNLLPGGELIGDGTLDLGNASKVTNQGAVRPGGSAPGILTIVGDWDQPLGSILEIDVIGPNDARGTAFDQLIVTGTLTRGSGQTEQGGLLRLVGDGAFDPVGSYDFAVVGAHAGPLFAVSLVNMPKPPRSIDYQDPKAIYATW